ncbi:DUF2452 domain-containing protein [Cellulophaga sp. Hel_I_12]|uniref:DUF2452 domain-containing protein n=1 Tax=Cellulophaga sp. Hel_I_12 TaxID=1249972 RepID=UPI00064743CB|nr:DUF2452 domain-containing protein [Cellulophaga sp. Hel_I_12]
MASVKKPDYVVFDADKEKYDAALKPYATSVGAPVITTQDTVSWKNRNIHQVNKQIGAKYQELKAEFDGLMEQFEYNNLVYSASFNFEPIVGFTYYLYRNAAEEAFLSVIAPDECNFDYIGTFKLNADKIWQKIKHTDEK